MNNKKQILNNDEKQKLLDTAEIIYKIANEISNKKQKSIWVFLKHPLFLLIVGGLISGFVVFTYQSCQAKIEEKAKSKYELLKEISLYTGKVFTAGKNVIYLHQKPIRNPDQIIKTNKDFNKADNEFNYNFINIDYKIRILLKNDKISEMWHRIKRGIEDLSKLLDLLHEFKTDEISEEHAKRIRQSTTKIKELETQLDHFSEIIIKTLSN